MLEKLYEVTLGPDVSFPFRGSLCSWTPTEEGSGTILGSP